MTTYTAEEVRACSFAIREHAPNEHSEEVRAADMLTAYADMLERQSLIAEPTVLAKQFHEAYERLAPSFGYETRDDTKAFDEQSPNGRLMIAVCAELQAVWPVAAAPQPGEPA